jgi:ribonucleoside-diphosphate reductase alpha chain
LPRAFVTADELSTEAHLAMVAALQPLVDGAIAKTINVPEDVPRDALASTFERAYALGLKGCTVFRSNTARGSVLTRVAGPCCRRSA